jgi:hypothetical protein
LVKLRNVKSWNVKILIFWNVAAFLGYCCMCVFYFGGRAAVLVNRQTDRITQKCCHVPKDQYFNVLTFSNLNKKNCILPDDDTKEASKHVGVEITF